MTGAQRPYTPACWKTFFGTGSTRLCWTAAAHDRSLCAQYCMNTAPQCAPRLPDGFLTTSSRLPVRHCNSLRRLGLWIDYLLFDSVAVAKRSCHLVCAAGENVFGPEVGWVSRVGGLMSVGNMWLDSERNGVDGANGMEQTRLVRRKFAGWLASGSSLRSLNVAIRG